MKEKTFSLPRTLSEIAMSLPERTATASIDNFIDAMKITKEEINSIVLAIKHQSEIPEWFKYKVGGIRVRNSKRVYTRYQTLLKKPNSCV